MNFSFVKIIFSKTVISGNSTYIYLLFVFISIHYLRQRTYYYFQKTNHFQRSTSFKLLILWNGKLLHTSLHTYVHIYDSNLLLVFVERRRNRSVKEIFYVHLSSSWYLSPSTKLKNIVKMVKLSAVACALLAASGASAYSVNRSSIRSLGSKSVGSSASRKVDASMKMEGK